MYYYNNIKYFHTKFKCHLFGLNQLRSDLAIFLPRYRWPNIPYEKEIFSWNFPSTNLYLLLCTLFVLYTYSNTVYSI